jgi:hypothetical protein
MSGAIVPQCPVGRDQPKSGVGIAGTCEDCAMRPMKTFLALAAAALLLAPAAHAAPGKLIAKASDSGLPVTTSTDGRALRPTAILVRIDATPSEPVQVSWDTSCSRGAKGKVREGDYVSTGTDLVRIKLGFKRPTDCLVNVIAAYENAALTGKIGVEIFARGRFVRRG